MCQVKQLPGWGEELRGMPSPGKGKESRLGAVRPMGGMGRVSFWRGPFRGRGGKLLPAAQG